VPVSVQLAGLKLPAPPLFVQVTVPVGVIAVPVSVSVTVAVQLVEPLATMLVGVQLTVVLVVRFGSTAVTPLLEAWVASPLYVAVMRCSPVPKAVGV